MKLNKKTNRHAVRALMNVPSLELRRHQASLKYFGKTKTMDLDRITRHVVELPEDQATGRGKGRNHQWLVRIMKEVESEDQLWSAYTRIKQSLRRNGNVLPTGFDPTLPDLDNSGKLWYHPTDRWASDVEGRVKEWNFDETLAAGKTLGVIQRACAKQEAVPRFALTKHPNCGPDQIRLRLLCGTSALNYTMSRTRRRQGQQRSCPDDSCLGEEEDTAHFLLDCETYDDLRSRYREAVAEGCTCEPREEQEHFTSCGEYYDSLNRMGKVLFMLGGPVNRRTPEPPVDSLARQYVQEAWKRRSQILNDQAEDPLVVDLTRQTAPEEGKEEGVPVSGRITSFFAPASNRNAPRTPPRTRATLRVDDAQAQDRYAYKPRSRRGIADDREGSGLNGRPATGIE